MLDVLQTRSHCGDDKAVVALFYYQIDSNKTDSGSGSGAGSGAPV